MAWTLNTDKPIYSQIVEILQMQIISGRYQAGDKLPSVRELATDASVNPNTMQKAFAELERSGLIITQRTSGRTVTEDEDMIKKIRAAIADEQIRNFFTTMKELGYNRAEIITLIEESKREDNEYGTVS